jgi:hypothetical protein
LYHISYGREGVQLINVTYSGDTLVATKATGDADIPRGQVSFTANLAPDFSANTSTSNTLLSPLKVSKASFPRFAGQGKVVANKPGGAADRKYVDGQLILMSNSFSFVWTPDRHHVLFRRPTPEQALSLLRNILSREDEMENIREFLARCLDMDITDSIARFHANGPVEPFRRIASLQDLETWSKNHHDVGGAAEAPWKFMQMHKWKHYLEAVLGYDDSAENTSYQ